SFSRAACTRFSPTSASPAPSAASTASKPNPLVTATIVTGSVRPAVACRRAISARTWASRPGRAPKFITAKTSPEPSLKQSGGSARWCGNSFPAFEVRDRPGQEITHLGRGEMAVQQPVARHGDRGGFFRYHEHRGIGLFGQTERRAVARAERLIGHLELREG